MTKWSPQELRVLQANIGKSGSEIAEMLPGKTRSAVIAKRHRLHGVMFASDSKRADAAQQRMAARAKLRELHAFTLKGIMAADSDRYRVVKRARELGIPTQMVADAFGKTPGWARWIAGKAAIP